MMKRNMLVLMVAVLLVCQAVSAQNASSPLIMVINQNIWAWNEGDALPRPLTRSGSILEISLSPDGSKLAYTQYPQVVIDAIQREGGFGGGSLPSDIWVMDITSGSTTPIAAQPPDASFAAANVPDKVVVHSRPVWSPDSTQLSWTEYSDVTGDPQQLMIYDFATATARAAVTGLTVPFGIPAPMDVVGWAKSGIVLRNVIYLPNQAINTQDVFLVYRPDGTLVSATPVLQNEARYLSGFVLLTNDDRDYLAVRYSSGDWDLINLQSGTTLLASHVPEIYSATSPELSVSVIQIPGAANEPPALQVLDAQGNGVGAAINVGYDAFGTVAISPDGQTLAIRMVDGQTYDVDQFVTLWRGGQTVGSSPLAAIDELQFLQTYVWGPTAWRLSSIPLALQPPIPAFECPGSALPPRLTVGTQGRVTPTGGPNNLRLVPGLSATKIGEIPENGVFTVERGPICMDALVWWQVNYNGQSGWTVEGQNGVYYLENLP